MKIAQNTKVSIVFTVQKWKSNIVVDSLYDHVKKFFITLNAKHSTLQKQKSFAIAMINILCKPLISVSILDVFVQ